MRQRSPRICSILFFVLLASAVGWGGMLTRDASAHSDSLKRAGSIGREALIGGWAWNGVMGWVSQRGPVVNDTGARVDFYGVKKTEKEELEGWAWSNTFGWVCWGKTCKDLDESKYGKSSPPVDGAKTEARVVPVEFPVHRNGTREHAEQCDDGNETDTDGCNNEGTGGAKDACGNGVKEGAEQCDDGDVDATNGCSAQCTVRPNACGNGVKEGAEQCDDGDRVNTNLCKNDCTYSGSTVERDRIDYSVVGWIKAVSLGDKGWISLSGVVSCANCPDKGKSYTLSYDPEKREFRGWAWSEGIGWVVFSGKTLYDTPYRYAIINDPGAEINGKTFEIIDNKITVKRSPTVSRVYQLNNNTIARVDEIDSQTNAVTPINEWGTVTIIDEGRGCQGGCEISFNDRTGKSAWKTQYLTPWVETVGGNIFSRKGFGGDTNPGVGLNASYLILSGGYDLGKDLKEDEELEISRTSDAIKKTLKLQKVKPIEESTDDPIARELDDKKETKIVRKGKTLKKITEDREEELADASELKKKFSYLKRGEEKKLYRDGRKVKVKNIRSEETLVAHAELYDQLKEKEKIVIKRKDGKLYQEKDGQESEVQGGTQADSLLKKREKGRIVDWESGCDILKISCARVARKADGGKNTREDAFHRTGRPEIGFLEKKKAKDGDAFQYMRRSALGTLAVDALIAPLNALRRDRNAYGYRVKLIQSEAGLLDEVTAGMGGKVYLREGDLVLGADDATGREPIKFNNASSGSGAGTIIIKGGDLVIYRPLVYEKSGNLKSLQQLASLAWIVLEENGKGGNIIIDDCIPPQKVNVPVRITVGSETLNRSIDIKAVPLAGIFLAEKTISTGKGAGKDCAAEFKGSDLAKGFSESNTFVDIPLYVDGAFIARTFRFERVYGARSGAVTQAVGSEFIEDTGRMVANTPPGLSDVMKTLPLW